MLAGSYGCRELGAIVGGADQSPFCRHLLDPALQDLSEPPCLDDVSHIVLRTRQIKAIFAPVSARIRMHQWLFWRLWPAEADSPGTCRHAPVVVGYGSKSGRRW